MAKNKKEERKIYRDFTMDEYDEFTLDNKREGAMEFKGHVLGELERRRGQVADLMFALPRTSDMAKELASVLAGLEVASSYIENMADYDDLFGCSECGSF